MAAARSVLNRDGVASITRKALVALVTLLLVVVLMGRQPPPPPPSAPQSSPPPPTPPPPPPPLPPPSLPTVPAQPAAPDASEEYERLLARVRGLYERFGWRLPSSHHKAKRATTRLLREHQCRLAGAQRRACAELHARAAQLEGAEVTEGLALDVASRFAAGAAARRGRPMNVVVVGANDFRGGGDEAATSNDAFYPRLVGRKDVRAWLIEAAPPVFERLRSHAYHLYGRRVRCVNAAIAAPAMCTSSASHNATVPFMMVSPEYAETSPDAAHYKKYVTRARRFFELKGEPEIIY